jgi:NAD(P)-dependent dehydrogenase (short-subunit alcohol dehydrogenase family)
MFGRTDTAIKYTKAAVGAISLAGKKVAVVGGTDGLGRAIAKAAVRAGAAPVLVVGRTFRDEGVAGLQFAKADLSLQSEAARVGRELPADLDVLVLSAGIMPGPVRKVTAEGIEMDMAVSALSRYSLLKELLPRAKPSARVFVIAFPGSGQKAVLDDLNSEKAYTPGMSQTHSNTVAVNEALVQHYGAGQRRLVYGLCPGLVATGIRANWSTGVIANVIEWVLGVVAPSAEQYAEYVLPLLVAPELEAHPGASFSQRGIPILPSEGFTDPAYIAQYMSALDALLAKAAQAAAKTASKA